jgi:hypothetical protein
MKGWLKIAVPLALIVAAISVGSQLLAHSKRRVKLEWNPSPGAQAYKIIYGPEGRQRTNLIEIGTRATVWVPRSATNYIRVLAIGAGGLESQPSTNIVVKP